MSRGQWGGGDVKEQDGYACVLFSRDFVGHGEAQRHNIYYIICLYQKFALTLYIREAPEKHFIKNISPSGIALK